MSPVAPTRRAGHCPLSQSVAKVAAAHLRREGLCVCGDGTGAVMLKPLTDTVNITEPVSLEDAWRCGVLVIKEDGCLDLCGQRFTAQWDQTKIRRKLEDRLRKISTTGELIRIAACLGVDIH